MSITDLGKRLLVGRKLRSTQTRETLLPKRVALPVFASDLLSSVAYSPDEIFLMLSLAGIAAYGMSWKIAIVIGVVMLTVMASYRQNVRTYRSGGGDYEVATTNLGSKAGLAVASALMVDYVLTVAVSISAAAQYAASAIPSLQGDQVWLAVAAVVFLMALNLRGVRESGAAFAVPAYLFMVAILGMALVGFARFALGGLPDAPSANLTLRPSPEFETGFTGLAAAFLLLRAFASGSATLTGVEAIANGVPAFRKPKGRNAAATLMILGAISVTMLMSVVVLANLTDVHVASNPASQLVRPGGGTVGAGYHQAPVIGQISHAVFSGFSPGFFFVAAATGVILVLAANTAFNGFPMLGSVLAKHGYMPRQLYTRGDRLAFSNGIFLLAAFAIVLILAFGARVTALIQLYIVGVFASFTLSQLGMVRHWNRLLRTEDDPVARRRMRRSRVVNACGLTVTAVVLVVVLLTKFVHGAWIAILAMVILFLLMHGIRRHYDRVAGEIAIAPDEGLTLPSRVHAIVLVGKLHKPALQALAFAQSCRPDVLEAVTVDVDPTETRRLQADWECHDIPVTLKVLASPYRGITGPVLDYVRSIRRTSPREIVAVYIPEYVVGRWWEQLLHNQSALRLKGRLLFTRGIMVTSVPYRLSSVEVMPPAGRPEPGHTDEGPGQPRPGRGPQG